MEEVVCYTILQHESRSAGRCVLPPSWSGNAVTPMGGAVAVEPGTGKPSVLSTARVCVCGLAGRRVLLDGTHWRGSVRIVRRCLGVHVTSVTSWVH